MASAPNTPVNDRPGSPEGQATRDAAAPTAALDTSAERIRLITERIHDIITRTDMTGRLLYVSPSCRRLGYEPEELLGDTGNSLLHPEDLANFIENGQLLIQTGMAANDRNRQHRFRKKDGSWVWLEGNPTVLTDTAGKPLEVINVFRDVTERRQQERQLAAKEAELQFITANAPDMLLRIDPQERILYASPSCGRFGYVPAQMIGRPRSDFIHPEDYAWLRGMVLQFAAEPAAAMRDLRYRFRRADGSYAWVESCPTYVRDGQGRTTELVTSVRDITARREIEAALADSEARFRRLAENASDIIIRFDTQARVTYISPAFELITGFAAAELIGRRGDVNIVDEDRPITHAAFQAAMSGRPDAESQRIQYRSRCKDGRIVWLESRPMPEIDAATGKVTGVTDIVRDISHRISLEDELRRARADAEAAADAKADLLATMSHELRTPLTSVIGFGRLVAEQPELTPTTRSYVARMGDASRALLSAVNDILDFSKLEAGKVVLNPEPTVVAELARTSLEMFQPQAGAKDITLEFDCEVESGLTVMIDPNRTRQVLLNLVGNAVKFTDDGVVVLRIGYRTEDEALEVEVRDTGPGIPSDRLDRLFQRYSEVDEALSRSHGGTGLGLAICKGIVESQGGQIGAVNQPTGGSCFYFTVPAPTTEREETSAGGQSALPFAGVRVLVVDDHPANRELAGLFLGGVGAELTYACDGVEAVEIAAEQPFDAILMDLRMPKLDGPGALRELRAMSGPNDKTPVLAFTAESGDAEIIANLRAAGFHGIVTKPLTAHDLIGAVAEAVN